MPVVIHQVPLEAVAFLGAVGVFLVLLLIFALYLNKALCFTNCGGFPCIDRPPKKDSNALDIGILPTLSLVTSVGTDADHDSRGCPRKKLQGRASRAFVILRRLACCPDPEGVPDKHCDWLTAHKGRQLRQ
ncbi:hypothetical protein BaRGS_00021661 [Batillaria attramentaria]|uniref:Uncharacterized protein n=1 Tax=Batillaria attramentaria TaxID=370345 RepID=A0ABD0KIV9_9CAEN